MAKKAKNLETNPTDFNKKAFNKAQDKLLNNLIHEDVKILSLEDDIRAFRDQIKDKAPIYTFDDYNAFNTYFGDIPRALDKLDELVSKSNYTTEQLSKKSLQQLLGIAKEVEKQAKADSEAILKYTKERTASLKETQGLPNDLVELRDKRDFGAETYFLRHCVGAGAADDITGVS